MNVDSAVGLLDAMANPLRLIILRMLCERELCVGEICRLTGCRQSLVSRHLAALRRAAIVVTRKDRQLVFYRCDSSAVRRMLSVIDDDITRYSRFRWFLSLPSERELHLGGWNSVVIGLAIGSYSQRRDAQVIAPYAVRHTERSTARFRPSLCCHPIDWARLIETSSLFLYSCAWRLGLPQDM